VELDMRHLLVLLIMLALVVLGSCNGTGGVPGPSVTFSRNVAVFTFHDPSPGSSVVVGARLDIDPVAPKDDREDWLLKVELLGGDGQDWVDVTQYYKEFVALNPQWSFDSSFKYTYAEPGTYILSARATYWDGEVVYSNGSVATVPHVVP
jgi:hypothetical protein